MSSCSTNAGATRGELHVHRAQLSALRYSKAACGSAASGAPFGARPAAHKTIGPALRRSGRSVQRKGGESGCMGRIQGLANTILVLSWCPTGTALRPAMAANCSDRRGDHMMPSAWQLGKRDALIRHRPAIVRHSVRVLAPGGNLRSD
jgi:hypothetical protein